MKNQSFRFWLKLSLISAISALFYHLSRSSDGGWKKEKLYTRLRKTRDKIKNLFKRSAKVEDKNRSVMYTLSDKARK